MRMEIFKFKKINANVYRCSQPYITKNKDTYVSIDPYITEDKSQKEIEKRYFVGITIVELQQGVDGSFKPKLVQRLSQKKFPFHTDLLREIVNIESGIMERITKRTFEEISFECFDFEYDSSKTYIRIGNMNSRLKQYLEVFETLELDEDLVFGTELKTRHKLLENFKAELLTSFSGNEHNIERVLKKYRRFLPLIMPGTNGTAEFQFIIDVEGYPTNRADIMLNDTVNFSNVVELKREDVKLFKKTTYRNNTCELTDEFSNSIQQTNMQRNMISASERNPEKVFVKSFLLIGNLTKEVQNHNLDEKLIRLNFNVVKYNNKDCEIITYDQIVDKIDLLLSKK